jgi:hypothetical protein
LSTQLKKERKKIILLLIHSGSPSGLPDSYFSNQKSQFGYILEDLGMENVVIYSGHLEYLTTIGYMYYMGIW